MYYNEFCLGHEISLSTTLEVLHQVQDLSQFAQKLNLPKQLHFEIMHSSSDESRGKISSFWIELNSHWHELKSILQECNETEAVRHVELLESYNHKG